VGEGVTGRKIKAVCGFFARAITNNHPKIMFVILCLFIGTGGKFKTSFAVIYTWP